MLTTENRLHFYVKVLNLPKTFEDAVEVTQRLGVRYLWIDSLCIIQDDTTDWAREAAVMYDVYKNAWCNLSATAARNSNGGLFWNRGRHSLVGQLVVNTSEKSVSDSRRQATDSLAANPKALLLLEDDLVVSGVERSPLQGRAWVLQERFLSRRVLHFAENQIFWECNQKCACEMFPDGILNGISYDGLRTVMPPGIPWIHVWTWAVRRYTERCHTYSSDKLPALSGIAKFFAPKLGGSYLAGIWRYEEFARQLAWYVDMEPSKLLSRPDYRAPTWSWASVDGAVRFPERRDEYRPMIELIDAEVTPKGGDPTGAVASGFLLVEGSLGHIPAGSRKSILGAAFVNFDIGPEPAGDMYLLPLYMDSESEYHGRSRDTAHPTFYTHYLLLIPHELDSSCFRRCGYAVPKNSQPYFHSTRVLQIGENLTRQGQFRIL
ncbi:hypothetical protein NUW58_g3494 [Xylaria curta]|uniref:Uncharacterized protein n=1 Tax=Xylaria curta TaxID=42375 RepID=A0ACC1PB92_9PEZI|nr:hypothetical protein NUW58_g3494 [Xylaria curta]